MSGDVLRRAAGLMRERAEAATPGPWFADDVYGTVTAGLRSAREAYDREYDNSDPDPWVIPESQDSSTYVPDLRHIASWHPAVALAVADWLDGEAAFCEAEDVPPTPQALAVARAYLGADAC